MIKIKLFRVSLISLPLLVSVTVSASNHSNQKFFYVHPLTNNTDDILNIKANHEKASNKFTADNFIKLRTRPLPAQAKICFQNKRKKTDNIKLNITQGSASRTIFLKKGQCTTVEKGWGSYSNILASLVKKFSGILAPDAVNDTFTASYNVGSNRDSNSPNANASSAKKPFCLDNYSGKSDIQPGMYQTLHIPFKAQYEGKSAVLTTKSSKTEIQKQIIKNGEAVFTNIDIKNGMTYAINIEQVNASAYIPLVLRTLDIKHIRMKANDEGVPIFDKKALSGNDTDNYDDEFADVLYDLKVLTNPELAYFHIYALNDLYAKSSYSYDLYMQAILPKIDDYKKSYCQPKIADK